MSEKLLSVEGLKVYYFTSGGTVKAVDKVDFSLYRGEALGIAGESGCGKSTLGYGLINLVPPPGRIVDGHILIDNVDVAKLNESDLRKKVRWRKISMVFQGAMNALTPVYTIGKQLAEPLTIHTAISYKEALNKVQEILPLVGLSPEIIRRYPHELSGGMKQRVMIAMALILNPDIIIADEPTTALDVIVQAQILNLLKKLRRELGVTLILISHDLSIMAEVVDRLMVMYAGKVAELGKSDVIFSAPSHPYTQGLIASIPKLGEKKLNYIPGLPPDLRNPPVGCRFADRCPMVMDICRKEEPPFFEIAKEHFVSCWLYR
jgi:peptide/nickel transport system ATP-binding protein